jgi:hypothetical protein
VALFDALEVLRKPLDLLRGPRAQRAPASSWGRRGRGCHLLVQLLLLYHEVCGRILRADHALHVRGDRDQLGLPQRLQRTGVRLAQRSV